MLAILGVLVIWGMISFFEIRPLVKKKWWREITVYCLLLSLSLMVSILLSLDVPVPPPGELIIRISSPITNLVERFLS